MNKTVEPKKKVTKKKGPIRIEAIIPVAIILGLSFIYFTYFFDNHLRKGLEWAGSQIHGAEVNIGQLRTSLFKASLQIKNIEITDKDQPQRNIVQIENIYLKFLWDALLRAKYVSDDAEIRNIQLYTPRKSPGRVFPPGKNSVTKNIENNLKNQIDEKLSDNFLGDIVQLIEGTDPKDQLKLIQNNLKSDQRIKELESIVKEKETSWKKRLKELPKEDELKSLEARAKKLEDVNTKDPVAIAKGISELKSIIKEADRAYDSYKNTSKDIKSEMSSLNKSVKELENFAKQDLNDLQKRLKIPSIDANDISKGLFAKSFRSELYKLQKYKTLARQYMPSKNQKPEEELIVPRKRGKGQNFKFPITTGYPQFWLKKALISSEPTDSEYSGKLKGVIKNITTTPSFIKQPATLQISGDFPKMKFYGFNSLVTVDHRTSDASEKIEASLASYPLSSFPIADDKNISLMLKEAQGRLKLNAILKNQKLNVNLKTALKNNKFDIKTKSKSTQTILSRAFNNIPEIDILSRAEGSWDKLSWHIRSNLGKELENAFKAELKNKVSDAKKQLKDKIDQKISKQKKQLVSKLDKSTGGVASQLTSKGTSIENIKSSLKTKLKAKEKSAKKEAKDKLKKKASKALKNLFK